MKALTRDSGVFCGPRASTPGVPPPGAAHEGPPPRARTPAAVPLTGRSPSETRASDTGTRLVESGAVALTPRTGGEKRRDPADRPNRPAPSARRLMNETVTEHKAVEQPVVESASEAVSDGQSIGTLGDRARSAGPRPAGEGGRPPTTERALEDAGRGPADMGTGCVRAASSGATSTSAHDAAATASVIRRGPHARGPGGGARRCGSRCSSGDRPEFLRTGLVRRRPLRGRGR